MYRLDVRSNNVHSVHPHRPYAQLWGGLDIHLKFTFLRRPSFISSRLVPTCQTDGDISFGVGFLSEHQLRLVLTIIYQYLSDPPRMKRDRLGDPQYLAFLDSNTRTAIYIYIGFYIMLVILCWSYYIGHIILYWSYFIMLVIFYIILVILCWTYYIMLVIFLYYVGHIMLVIFICYVGHIVLVILYYVGHIVLVILYYVGHILY